MSLDGPSTVRLCIAVDAVNHTNPGASQCGLLDVLDAASAFAGLRGMVWHRLASRCLVAMPQVGRPDQLVVDRFLRELDAELFRYNATRRRDDRLRVRVAIHCGQSDERARAVAGRLVDSVILHEALRLCPDANLGVLLSARVFDASVAALGTTIRPGLLRKVRDRWDESWLLVPGRDVHQLPLDSSPYAASWNTSPSV